MTVDIDDLNKKAHRGLDALTELLASDVASYVPALEDRRPFLLGWGFVAALHRQACAVVFLHREGFSHEAAPNRRLVIEYVARLQWLARDGEVAVDSMNKAFQSVHARLREAADADGLQYDEDAANAVRDADLPSNLADQYNHVGNFLRYLGGSLHHAWLGETQLSHATLTAAQSFYREYDEGLKLLGFPDYGLDGDPTAASPFIAFTCLYLGMEAFGKLMVGSPWTAELDRIGAEAGLSDTA
ncbi:hypothetical protein KGD82_11180 [Nocardiopsis eucommiae]|uniref:Uncharacterized protein n=1 Tax=Nocardiopsis eucommiae TaxID=2831970 RepID=A0A975LB53_9ACTN|nr:hypothetical protein KGD82_11180 [Nocardiopsis eucommiae]